MFFIGQGIRIFIFFVATEKLCPPMARSQIELELNM